MHRNKSELNFSKRTLLNHSVGCKTRVFGVFTLPVYGRTSLRNWPGRAVLAIFAPGAPKQVGVEFFETNGPKPLRMTQNSSFGRFRTSCIRTHDVAKLARKGRFGCFGPRCTETSRSRIFRNERSQTTPYDPKLKFSGFLHFPFTDTRCCETGQKEPF